MEKFISTKEMYNNFKAISNDVMENGSTYVVLKYSKPAYKITPLDQEIKKKKKYTTEDIHKFTFTSKNKKEKSLATNFKKYIYQA